MASSGMAELTPSTLPRLVSSVTSVIQALKQESFDKLPKKVITQSKMMVRVMPKVAMAAASRARAAETLCRPAKARMERPHMKVPPTMNSLRLPTRSDHAPTKSVVAVAVRAEADTMSATSESDAPKASWMNRLKKLFSTAQATWPTKASMTTRNHFFLPRAVGASAADAEVDASVGAAAASAAAEGAGMGTAWSS